MLVLSGLAFLVVALPFVLNYSSSHPAPSSRSYEEMLSTSRALQGAQYYDVGLAVAQSLRARLAVALCFLGVVGAIIVSRRSPSRNIACLLRWLVGLVLASAGIAVADQLVSRALRRLPAEIDLIRNLRYAIPVALALLFWCAQRWWEQLKNRPRWIRGAAVACIGGIALSWYVAYRPNTIPYTAEVRCLRSGHLVCPPVEELQRVDLLRSVAALPVGARILPVSRREDLGLFLRYGALASVAYCPKDKNVLVYAGIDRLEAWVRESKAIADAVDLPDRRARVARLPALATRFGAGYVVVEEDLRDISELPDLQLLHATAGYSLLKVSTEPLTGN
jgi:hypothetical protein